MKVISNINDLMRIYRVRDLIDNIKIDYSSLLANHIGIESYKVDLAINTYVRIKNGFTKINSSEKYEEINNLILNFETINKEFKEHLKVKVGNDILEYIKDITIPLYILKD